MKKHSAKCASLHNVYKNGEMVAHCKCMSNHECDCDGYHTFDELYDHRIELWIALCKMQETVCNQCDDVNLHPVWRSKRHSDGELAFGGKWFLLGMERRKGAQITYHLPISRWDDCSFANTIDKAPEFDGHTSDDVLKRIKVL